MVVGYVGENEEVLPFNFGVMPMRSSASCPILLQDERQAFLVFYLDEHDPTWDGTFVRIFDPLDAALRPIGIIHWKICYAAILSRPNIDVWYGHRLWKHGLKGVMQTRAGEVHNSAWIALLERQNSMHPSHRPGEYRKCRHFILLFHDSTFECVANGYTVQTSLDSMPNVLNRLFHEP